MAEKESFDEPESADSKRGVGDDLDLLGICEKLVALQTVRTDVDAAGSNQEAAHVDLVEIKSRDVARDDGSTKDEQSMKKPEVESDKSAIVGYDCGMSEISSRIESKEIKPLITSDIILCPSSAQIGRAHV